MFRFVRVAALAAPLLLAACAAGERGLVSPHQPVVSATDVTVPGCPDWHDRNWPPSEGQSTNYGCASALNLAAMIADPADLIHGKKGDGTSAADTAVRAMRAQRENGTGKAIEKTSSKATQ